VHFVYRAAVWALGRSAFGHVKVNLGVRVPLLHASNGRWAINAALSVEVGGFEFNSFTSSHSVILEDTIHPWQFQNPTRQYKANDGAERTCH
jgi:hypothetical protein